MADLRLGARRNERGIVVMEWVVLRRKKGSKALRHYMLGGIMKTVGRHLIAELYGCQSARLGDVDWIEARMLAAAECIGATVKGWSFHRFEPGGVSGAVVIAESHLSIHTWPEKGYVAIDIFSCGPIDPLPGARQLARDLEANDSRVQEIHRGIPEELEDARQWLPRDIEVMTRWSPLLEGDS